MGSAYRFIIVQAASLLLYSTRVGSLHLPMDISHYQLHTYLDHVTSLPVSVSDAASIALTIKKSIATELDWWSYIFSGNDDGNAAIYKPARLPLSPLLQVEPEDLREYARAVKAILEDTVDVLKEGILPENNEDLVAIFTSEACAGALGGISSQIVSILLNDEKRSSLLTETITDASFFGIRSVVRAIATILGLPQPVVNVAAPIIATLASESAKIEATRREQDMDISDMKNNDMTIEDQKEQEEEQIVNYMPFDQNLHSVGIGQKVFDRRSWLRREIAISRGQNDGNTSKSDLKDCFGVIVDIVYHGSSGQVKSVLCEWEGVTSYKADVDNRSWMKASDVWIVKSMISERMKAANNFSEEAHVFSEEVKDEKDTGDMLATARIESNGTALRTARLTSFKMNSTKIMEKDRKTLISFPEIAQDVAKWVSYNSLLPSSERTNYPVVAEYGLLAGMIGCLFFELTSSNRDRKSLKGVNDDAKKDSMHEENVDDFFGKVSDMERNKEISSLFPRFLNAGLEGAALFVAYEASLQLLDVNSDIRQVLVDKTKRIPFIPYVN